MLHRRLLLQLPVILAGPLTVGPGRAAEILPRETVRVPDLSGCRETMSSYVDTLLPAVGDSPAGSALGIVERVLEVAQVQPPYARLMRAGCIWLETEAKADGNSSFARLGEAQREAIVARAEASERRSMQAQFFLNTHRHAMELFYSRPGSWPALDYSGPPQPRGFMDHDRPPGDAAA